MAGNGGVKNGDARMMWAAHLLAGVVGLLGVRLHVFGVKPHVFELPLRVEPAWSVKWGEAGWLLWPPVTTERATTRGPNSTTATKLLPTLP